jgi:hypothetical protein
MRDFHQYIMVKKETVMETQYNSNGEICISNIRAFLQTKNIFIITLRTGYVSILTTFSQIYVGKYFLILPFQPF